MTSCDRCGRSGATYRPDLWLDLHDECIDDWWKAVEAERQAKLTIQPRTGHWADDDPDELRKRGVL
jgi:hypothetical protein